MRCPAATNSLCCIGSTAARSTSNSSPDLDFQCGDPKDAADHVASITTPNDNEHDAPSPSKPTTSPSTMAAGTVIAEAAGSSRSFDFDTCTSLKQYGDVPFVPFKAIHLARTRGKKGNTRQYRGNRKAIRTAKIPRNIGNI